jgi:TatD DNase family protein
MSSPLVDFHCHLDLYPDYEKIIQESERLRVYTLAVTTTPRAWKRNQLLTTGLTYVRPALGLHPQLIGDGTPAELRLWESLLSQTKYVGEVGIDAGPIYRESLDEQKRVFERILMLCANEGNKVLSIHAVRATNTVLDMIEALLPPDRGVVVLHWFTGTPAQARRAVKLGCYFSINISMLRSKNGQNIIKQLPIDRILTETDGPFTNVDSNPCKPKDVIRTVEILSGLLEASPDSLRCNILANLKKVLG